MKNQIALLVLLSGFLGRGICLAREVCVLDHTDDFTSRFDASQTGDVPPISRFGWLNEMESSPAITLDSVNGEIIIANVTSFFPYADSINFYNQDSEGNTSPVRTIRGRSTGLGYPTGVAIDARNDEVLVANNGGLYGRESITVYARTSTGDAPPLRTIVGPSTRLQPTGLAVDVMNDEIFVTNGNNTVTVYPRTSDGNVPPLRTIAGLPSGLMGPTSIAVDDTHDEILVANQGDTIFGSITAYPRTADGFVSPLRRITSPGMRQATGIALDLGDDEIFVATPFGPSVLTFPRLGNGEILPLRELARLDVFLQQPTGIVHDPGGDQLVITDRSSPSALLRYPRLSSGPVPPTDSNDGRSTALAHPVAMDVDLVNGEIWVVNGDGPGLRVYQIDAAGDVRPLRAIEGPSTQLLFPSAVAVDTVRDEVLVADSPSWVRVYPRSADGDVAPLRMARLCVTDPCRPYQMAIDTLHGEMFALWGGQLSIHPLPGEGYIPPRAVIQVGGGIGGIAADPVHDEIFVSTGTSGSILVYDRGSPGLPIREIAAYQSGIGPLRLTVDLDNDEILVLAEMHHILTYGIAAFPRTANGPGPPTRTIYGVSVGLREPVAISMCQ